MDTARTFVINATAAKKHRGNPPNAEICRLAKGHGFRLDPAHLGRILKGSHTPGLDYVAGIAAALQYKPWQLLAPVFDPANPPRILTARQAAVIDQLAAPPDGES